MLKSVSMKLVRLVGAAFYLAVKVHCRWSNRGFVYYAFPGLLGVLPTRDDFTLDNFFVSALDVPIQLLPYGRTCVELLALPCDCHHLASHGLFQKFFSIVVPFNYHLGYLHKDVFREVFVVSLQAHRLCHKLHQLLMSMENPGNMPFGCIKALTFKEENLDPKIKLETHLRVGMVVVNTLTYHIQEIYQQVAQEVTGPHTRKER